MTNVCLKYANPRLMALNTMLLCQWFVFCIFCVLDWISCIGCTRFFGKLFLYSKIFSTILDYNDTSRSIAQKISEILSKFGALQGLIPKEPCGGGPCGWLLPSGISLGPNGSLGGRPKFVLPSSAASSAESSISSIFKEENLKLIILWLECFHFLQCSYDFYYSNIY